MTNTNLSPDTSNMVASNMLAMTHSLRNHWRLYLTEGIILIILGMAAILVPPFASLTIAIFLGWLLFIGGTFSFVATAVNHHVPGFWWSLLSSAVAIVAGIALIGWPVSSVASLTLVLTAFLIADGILTILFAIEHRRLFSRRWGWLLLNGLLDLALAGVIVWALPQSATWALGIIVGVDMLFGGASLIAVALAAHNIRSVNGAQGRN